MKNIIFKTLVIGAMVFGVSVVANAQDATTPVTKIKQLKQEQVKNVTYTKALQAESMKPRIKSVKRAVRKRAAVKQAAYVHHEKALQKREVK